MSNKHKITLSLSLVLALLFSLPWVTLIEQVRVPSFRGGDSPVLGRIMFMFVTVFTTSVVLFIYNFFWKYSLESKSRTHRVAVRTAFNLFLIILTSILYVLAASEIFNLKALKAYFIIYFFRNATIAVVVVLVVYVVELIERLRQEKIEVLTLQRENIETELATLKSQIDPHFLFNTLTTLSSLVRMNSKETISFVDHMADSFRYMLENRKQKLVTVRDELSFLQSYIFMMKKRFEDGLHVDMSIRDEHLDRAIPQFALQAAVENAMKHNIVSTKQTLHIEMRSDGDCIAVWNNLNEKKSSQGYGIGLDNLAQRYWLMGKKIVKVTKGANYFQVILPLL
jgi:sensor histidine kinase YesM